LVLTDTPIYDQIRRELESGPAPAERPSARRSRAADEESQTVSVWSLVNQHRGGKRH
jgi:hypothetical protein